MIVKGASRGYTGQWADYVTTMGKNLEVRVLAIHGTTNLNDVKEAALEMGRFEEITKSKNPIFHAIIRPSHKESFEMTDDQWLYSVLDHQKKLGFENLPFVTVLHRDDDGWHSHTGYQKYDPAIGKMRPDNHTHKKNDKTREHLEIKFNHPRTRQKNPDHPKVSERVIDAWKDAKNGREFIELCKKYNYTIAGSTARRPFLVIDEHGTSFDLIKSLTNKKEKFSVRTNTFREAIKGINLPLDKDIIRSIRSQEKVHENKELFEDLTDEQKKKEAFRKKMTERRGRDRGR